MPSPYTTRLLPPADWAAIAPIYLAHGGDRLPDPSAAAIAVTECDGQIVGFLVAQLVPHFEPLWIHPDHRGRVSWRRLVRLLEGLLPGQTYYTFTTSPAQARMATISGLMRRPWAIFQRSIPCRS